MGSVAITDQPEIDDFDDVETGPKIFSQKRINANITSRLGSLIAQKLEVPEGMNQVVCLESEADSKSKELHSNSCQLIKMMEPLDPDLIKNLQAVQNSWT